MMEEEDIEHFVAKTICAAMMDVMKIHTITITVNNDGNGRCDKDFVAIVLDATNHEHRNRPCNGRQRVCVWLTRRHG